MKFCCPDCRASLKVVKIGVTLLETIGEEQLPYQFFNADLLKCPLCGYEIVYTDARAFAHSSTLNPTLENEIILKALSYNALFLSHEKPLGGAFAKRIQNLKGEQ